MQNLTLYSSQAKFLKEQFFLQGSADALFPPSLTDIPEWTQFSESWNDLHQDQYMADGGKYRFRRYSEFSLALKRKNLSVLKHVPYRQSKKVNYLNGDIDRQFSPIHVDIQNNKAFQQVLFSCANVLEVLHPDSTWLVQVFQNRIFARPDEPGKPTPEGVHRDGVDYVLTFMINRQNVVGGESAAYDARDGKQKSAVTLFNAGDFIFLDDNKTTHGVEPITRADETKDGYRDVLIVMYTKQG